MLQEGFTWKLEGQAYQKYVNWCKKWNLDGYQGAIGGAVTFELTPTSLGMIVKAKSAKRNGNDETFSVEIVLEEI